MRILCLNPAVSMRAYRQMKALHDRGHEISLLYMGFGDSVKKVDENFWVKKEQISFSSMPLSHIPGTLNPARYRKLVENELSKNDYDIVHSYSMPDVLGTAATRYSGKIPKVFDTRDMVTSFQKNIILRNYIPERMLRVTPIRWLGLKTFYKRIFKLEKEANVNSDGRVYVSDYAMELARKKHSIPEENSIPFYNYAMKRDITTSYPKLSDEDGEAHIVFEGVLTDDGYRKPLLDLFKTIARTGIHLHIYGVGKPEVIRKYTLPDRSIPHYHFEGSLPHPDLMKEMTRYDFGLIPFIPFGNEREHMHTMLPNKQFDYLVSGLPLIVPDSRSMVEFVKRTKTGIIFRDVKDLPTLIENDHTIIDREEHVIENKIHIIEDLYKRLCE